MSHQQTLAKIEAAIMGAHKVDHKKKAELVGLLEQLRAELKKEKHSPDLIESVNEKLTETATGVQSDHPQLAALVNDVSLMLAKIGI